MRGLVLAVLVMSACTPAITEPGAPSASTPILPAYAGVGGLAMRTVAMANGLAIDVPATWSVGGDGFLNRATQRAFIASNGDLGSLPTVYGNGDIDAAALAVGRVVVEVESFCRPSCQGPAAETGFPLDWGDAVPMFPAQTLPPGHHQLAVSLRWFNLPMYLVARWADDAIAEVALLPAIVKSLRPSLMPPVHGDYRGWDAVAPLTDIPVGTVRFESLPAGAIIQQPLRIYDAVPFFVVRGKQDLYAFVSLPLHEQPCVIYYDPGSDHFACTVASRTYEWTRFGTYLGPEPASNLAQHAVIVRDGIVWVQYTRDWTQTPSVPNEPAER